MANECINRSCNGASNLLGNANSFGEHKLFIGPLPNHPPLLLLLLLQDISRQLLRYRITPEKLKGMVCEKSPGSTTKANVTRQRVKTCLRNQLQATIGNYAAVDMLFDAAKPDSNDRCVDRIR
jgi:hypothetical protein